MSLKIYHNPRCSKSRQALALLTEAGAEFDIVEYLKTGLSVAELEDLATKSGGDVRAMMRTGEAVYKELGLKNENDEAALIKAMAENPILLERPLVSDSKTAIICRPPELAAQFLA
ncbi:MAG: arsenate reductase (glutaredoxin) [Parvibaculales bacterium]